MRVAAFHALRPPAELAAEVASVPYDVINTRQARALAEGKPRSFLHVIRPEIDLEDGVDPYDARVYDGGRAALETFKKEGWLQEDEDDALYLYRQQIAGHAQTGIVACCHVDDYPEVIKRHEFTRKVKEDDRTRHVLTTRANTGPVFLTYRDEATLKGLITEGSAGAPLYDFEAEDGVRHTVWKVSSPDAWTAAFQGVPCAYVADGHHRTASAARAGQELREQNPGHRGDEAYNWFLTVLFPASELRILPYHRVLLSLNDQSANEVVKRLGEVGELEDIAEPGPPAGACDIYVESAWRRLTFDPASIDKGDAVKSLDVALVQDRVLEPIFGIKDPRGDDRIDFVGGVHGTGELERRVNEGEARLAIAMPATTLEQLMRVADAGEVMPPKSTWFEPKLRSGLFVHEI